MRLSKHEKGLFKTKEKVFDGTIEQSESYKNYK